MPSAGEMHISIVIPRRAESWKRFFPEFLLTKTGGKYFPLPFSWGEHVETFFHYVSRGERSWEIFPTSFFPGRTRGNYFPRLFPRGKVVGNVNRHFFPGEKSWEM